MNLEKIDAGGSHLQFRIETDYEDIVSALGEPHVVDDPQRVDVSWHVIDRDTDRELAIWNYKNGPAYRDDVDSVREVTTWSAWGSEELAEELGLIVSYKVI